VDDCFIAITFCIRTLKRHQTDTLFHSIFEGVKEEASSRCDSPVLPRQRQIPRKIDSGSSQHVFTFKKYFRKDYYESITASHESLRDISVKLTSFLCRKLKVCYLIVPWQGCFYPTIPPQINQIYDADIDIKKLLLYQKMLLDAIISDYTHILEDTRVQTTCHVFNENESGHKELAYQIA